LRRGESDGHGWNIGIWRSQIVVTEKYFVFLVIFEKSDSWGQKILINHRIRFDTPVHYENKWWVKRTFVYSKTRTVSVHKLQKIENIFLVAPNIVWEPLSISQSLCVCLCVTAIVQDFKKYVGIELQMSEQVVNTLPTEPHRIFNLSYYFTK